MDFKMSHIDIKCPVCGELKYMHFMQGKNVGELDMVCTNCGHYFMSKNFPQTNQQIEKCTLCESLEDGDTLYSMSDWDGGIGFDYIRDIHFCPKCGRDLRSANNA